MRRWLNAGVVALMGGLLSAGGTASAAGQTGPQGALRLTPVPESVNVREGRFRIDDDLGIGGPGGPGSRPFKAAARFMARLAGRTGLFLKQDFLAAQPVPVKGGIRYDFGRAGRLEPFEDESYRLTVGPEGVALSAKTDIGVLRGLETLLQLLSSDEAGYYFPALEITDKPRFTWRGLMIDSGRHFHPVDVIRRNIDAMAALKMNVFHWHLTEDQGFRVESKVLPRLHELGSDGMYYTQAQIREVIEYAAERGVRVMPEFDIPGHSTSWLVAYPEFSSAAAPQGIERRFGIFGATFNPADERVYGFLDKFIREMSALFPDPYLHIGGDEVEGHQWEANPAIRSFKQKNNLADNQALQAYFNKRMLKILTRCGKKMVGWDEIFQPGLPTDIVIHSWRGQEALGEAARQGYQGILSNGYYIDLCQPAEFHYLNDPVPADSRLTEAQKSLVLGGEATMWSELVTPETIDSRIWPRTAAIAERLWSRQSVANVEDLYRRLAAVSRDLEELGLTHRKNQDMMLRRLAGEAEVGPLRLLAGVVEPLKHYQRHSQGPTYTSLVPLTRFVDACQPESWPAREFRLRAERFLQTKDPVLGQELRETCLGWAKNHPLVLPLIARSPALREIEPLSSGLASAASIAIEALGYLGGGTRPPDGWIEAKKTALAEASKPAAHAELAVVPAVEKLVDACGGTVR